VLGEVWECFRGSGAVLDHTTRDQKCFTGCPTEEAGFRALFYQNSFVDFIIKYTMGALLLRPHPDTPLTVGSSPSHS
jgi:hypothetical protein